MTRGKLQIDQLLERIKALRLELRPYILAQKRNEALSDDALARAREIVASIVEAKVAYIDLGGNPKGLEKGPRHKKGKKVKRATTTKGNVRGNSAAKKVGSRRSGGVGVYGMGLTTKFWR